MTVDSRRGRGRVSCRLAVLWGLATASLVSAQPVDLSFEQQGTALGIPVGRVGPGGEQWGFGWSGSPCASSGMTPGSGAWVGGTLARSEDYCWGWKVSPSGHFFAIIKDRQPMTQAFTAGLTTGATLTWLESNRASWRNVDWYGRPNTYAIAIIDEFGAVQDLGTYQSEVAGGNSWSTPPGDAWWTESGKQTWQTRTSPPFTLIAGLAYTLRFESLSPFWYLPDGGLGGVDDRTTFIDGIVFTPGVDAGTVDAGGFDGGTIIDAGTVDAGDVDAGTVDAGDVDAGSVDAGDVDAGSVDSGDVDAGSIDAGDVDAGSVDSTDVESGGTVPLLPDAVFRGGGCGCTSPNAGSLLALAGLLSWVRRRRMDRR